jgi:hypothetical protein
MFRQLSEKPSASTVAILLLLVGMCVPVFGFNRIPLHDMLHALMHYNFVARDWVTEDSLLGLWNPYREYGMNLFVEHIFNFHPFQYVALLCAKIFPDQNTITATKLVYVCINGVFAIGLYKLLMKITDCKFGALFAAITAGLYFPWFASPSFNLVTVWLLPVCYYTAVLFMETRKIKWILVSFIFLGYSSIQGNGYLGLNVILAYVAVLSGFFYQYKNIRFLQRNLLDSPALVIVLICVGLGLLTGLYLLYLEFTEQFFLTTQRNSTDGKTDLRMFLTFATPSNLSHFGGFWHGVSTSRDGVAYAGFLVPALAIYGLFFSTNFRLYVPYLAGFLVIFGLALGSVSFVALIAFHIPGFSFYRHLGLLLPIAKFHLVIIAAISLSVFLKDIKDIGISQIRKRASNILVPLLLVSIFCALISLGFGTSFASGDFYPHSRYALLGALFLALLIGYNQFSRRPQPSKKIGILILTIVAIDGLSFYSEQAFMYTAEISDKSYNSFKTSTEFYYEKERYRDASHDADFASLIRQLEEKPDIWSVSATYDSTYGATDTEPCYSAFRRFSTSIYLKPLYTALDAIDGRTYPLAAFESKIDRILTQMRSSQSMENDFPHLLYSADESNVIVFSGRVYAVPQKLGNISLNTWRSGAVINLPGVKTTKDLSMQPRLLDQSIGCESPKIKLVDQCRVSIASDRQSVDRLLDILRHDDAPFTLNIASDSGLSLEEAACDSIPNQSTIEGISFSPNNTFVDLDVREASQWLYFGYSWNSKTKIFVDGEERPAYRTNLGFISTPLRAGDSRVILHRAVPSLLPRVLLISLNILITLAIFLVLLQRNSHILPHEDDSGRFPPENLNSKN